MWKNWYQSSNVCLWGIKFKKMFGCCLTLLDFTWKRMLGSLYKVPKIRIARIVRVPIKQNYNCKTQRPTVTSESENSLGHWCQVMNKPLQ